MYVKKQVSFAGDNDDSSGEENSDDEEGGPAEGIYQVPTTVSLNLFTPKNDQFQISPAASPEI